MPLTSLPDWERVKAFCHAFAELMTHEAPDRYLAHLKITDRRRVLVDWLGKGDGQHRDWVLLPARLARAPVAAPLAWDEVGPDLLAPFT